MERVLARFTLTEPVELGDMAAMQRAIKAALPGSRVEVFRHRAIDPLMVRVDADGIEPVVRAMVVAP